MKFDSAIGLDRPVRLSQATRTFAWESLNARYGKEALENGSVPLDGIPGVGPKRKAELLRRFGSLKAIRAAGLTELENLLPAPTAAEVYRHFHETKEEPPCESSPEVPEA